MSDAQTIARGEQPRWTEIFNHPEHGELQFAIEKLPTGRDWLQIAGVQETIAPSVTQGTGAILAESIAGLLTLAKLPVISEQRIVDPDNPGHEKLVQRLYDPLDDERWEFPTVVWAAFLAWRTELLSEATKDAVKNSSGATTSSDSVAPSPVDTDSPLSTAGSPA